MSGEGKRVGRVNIYKRDGATERRVGCGLRIRTALVRVDQAVLVVTPEWDLLTLRR